MSKTHRLHLEDCMEDIPKTRAMIDVFEKDAATLKKFSRAFTSSCQKISNAQVMMISATQELSYYLRLFGQQSFALDAAEEINKNENADTKTNENGSLTSVLNNFANYIDEISTCFQVFATQINDAMIYPLNKLVDNEFDDLTSLSKMYQISSDEQEMSLQKYLRLSNRKEYDQQRKLVGEEVFLHKKKFHETAMNYFSSLNLLQFKRKYMLVEPLLSFMHGLKLFFKMGAETFNSDSSSIAEFLNQTSTQVCEVKAELSEEINKNNQLIELLQQDETIYNAEQPDTEALNLDQPIDNSLLHKYGYLNLKSRIPFISKWDRSFYFIQNGCLMHQQKNEVAGYVFLELKSDMVVSPCEIDERPFTFQINSQFPKRIIYLQANNERDRNEWIRTLQSTIKDDNRAKIQNYMNSSRNLSNSSPTHRSLLESNVQFELSEKFKKEKTLKQVIIKPQYGDLFKVRYLGSMNVRADKGNEYIHETIRQVMAARAKHNIFKMNEFNLIINSESLSLFAMPEEETKSDESADRNLSILSSDDLLKARFDLADLAFWSSHKENSRLFGFIIKEPLHTLKFLCLVFESDVNSIQICESITKATQLAFQLLIDENKSEHFKKIKQAEREILLQNIRSLPDLQENNDEEIKENGEQLLSVVVNTPNPSFLVLDKDVLESLRIDGLNENESNDDNNYNKENDLNDVAERSVEPKKPAESDA